MEDCVFGAIIALSFAGTAILCSKLSKDARIGNIEIQSGWRACAIFCIIMTITTLIILVLHTTNSL